MTLSDSTIYAYMLDGANLIDPFDLDRLQPASYDLTLADQFKYLSYSPHGIRPGVDVEYDHVEADVQVLMPDMFVLASTVEFVTIPNNLLARVEGKSSLGRIGLMAHVTAGFIDPGFRGNITLELKNVGSRPIMLKQGMSIAQLAFSGVLGKVDRPYGHPQLKSRYQGSRGVIGARSN